MVTESLEHEVLAKESSQPKSTYEVAALLRKFKLKKILIDKIDEIQSYLTATEHGECYDGLIKSYDLDKSLFSTYDKVYSLKRSRKDKDKDEDPSAGSDEGLKKRKTSKDVEPTKGLKTKESKSGSSKGTKSQSKSSGKSVQTFYGYARGLESSHDVYSTKRILAVTRVEDGDFLRLRINDIEDMLLLVVQNRHVNLLGNDVSNFTIALQMFTGSMVIQKKVKDLQLGVKSYQKKINITKPETTRPDIRKWDPYIPYQDPQGFIYVDNKGRNRLMRSDELYKFSDGTLTWIRTSLDDITKNIRMEYLPQRRWSLLEKKRAYIMIKDIDKQLKERRMMRSFEKFVGGRHYGTNL
ncbi:hypothetical protein Tco_1530777 [Tanacetum coccineum]